MTRAKIDEDGYVLVIAQPATGGAGKQRLTLGFHEAWDRPASRTVNARHFPAEAGLGIRQEKGPLGSSREPRETSEYISLTKPEVARLVETLQIFLDESYYRLVADSSKR